MIEKPIYVSAESSDVDLETKRLELQATLDRLVEKGVKWRDNG
jgi:hypothetical protein